MLGSHAGNLNESDEVETWFHTFDDFDEQYGSFLQ